MYSKADRCAYKQSGRTFYSRYLQGLLSVFAKREKKCVWRGGSCLNAKLHLQCDPNS